MLKTFFSEKIKVFLFVSIVVNLLLVSTFLFILIKYQKVSENLSSVQDQINKTDKLERSRMNGVFAKQEEGNKKLNELVNEGDLGNLDIKQLSELEFSKTIIDYRTSFDKFSTETNDGINIYIEKIENRPPYLSVYSPSEFLGLTNIDSLVTPFVYGTIDPKVYNSKIGSMNFAKSYEYYPVSYQLRYETVMESKDQEYLYHITFNSDWEDVGDKSIKPDEWFSKHPSEKFKKLEDFMKSVVKK